MEYMTSAQIREKFLKYFEDKGCKRMPSSSLIPDDPSLLLTSAGMVQFKPYFLHQKNLDDKYIGTTTVQKCVRTNDIDIIGTTGRHLTFFEMLGNFSFGKYFKAEMCKWSLDFSVNVMGMPMEKLYFTVFEDDDETIEIWKSLGVDPGHITRLGEDDNFWRAGPTGPCGPCSELYYDQGPDFGCGSPDCAPGCDCDRYLEFWNLVFTQFDGQENGTLAPLPTKNIDTGMGLERMAAIMQGAQSNYDTDVMKSLIGIGEDIFDVKYGNDDNVDLSLRIIADHSRAITFMIADGILPGNESREYVLRRLIRRCVFKAYLLGQDGPFLDKYIDEVIKLMGDVYHEIVDNKKLIKRIVLSEENRFCKTLTQGTQLLNDLITKTKHKNKVMKGENVFLLHDTYGFPMEVTKEIVESHGFTIDEEGFNKCMKEQVERARAANVDDAEAAWDLKSSVAGNILSKYGPTKFVGYDILESSSKIISIVKDNELVDSIEKGDSASIFVESTPFYAEMGGQVGDIGFISNSEENEAEVTDCLYPEPGLISHRVKVIEGSFKVGDEVDLEVDAIRRSRIQRNHTATHILHWALRQVLGDHVKQAGSYVAPERLRFDFTHFEALSADQLKEVEKLANDQVMRAYNVETYNTSLKEARESGVTALFGEKYGENVRVVNVGEFSRELCGGCHVSNTAEIGLIKVLAESSVGSNARRIEACTSYDAYDFCTSMIEQVNNSAALLKCPSKQLSERVEANLKTIKELKKELELAYSNTSTLAREDYLEQVIKAKDGYDLSIINLDNIDNYDIKECWDLVVDHCGDNCAAVLGGVKNNKALLLAAGTSKAVDLGFDAISIIKEISPLIKGGGGGKPRMAQAGGSDVSGIQAALDKAREILT